MQSQALKLTAIGLVALSLVLAFVGYRISTADRNGLAAVTGQSSPDSHEVVIAVHDLIAGQTLKSADLAVVTMPIEVEKTFSDVAPLYGRTLRRNVFAAELLRESAFEAGGTLARETAPGMRAVAVKVDEIIAAGGFLQPGDRVDVYYAVRSTNETGDQSLARLMVRGARILAFGDSIAQQAGKDGSDKRSRSAVLEVEPAIVSQLLLAETTGALRLAAIGDREAAVENAIAEKGQDQRVSLQDLIASPNKSRRDAPKEHAGVEVFQGDQKQLANTR